MFIETVIFNSKNCINNGCRYFLKANGATIFFGSKLPDRLTILEVGKSGHFIIVNLLFDIGT
ncbi:hypothetical protein D3C77_751850 [compost metagenome]